MVALATAFVALGPQLNVAAFARAGQQAGAAAGRTASDGFFKSSKGRFAGAANLLVPLALAGAVKKIYDIGTAYQDNLNIFQAVTKATGAQMDKVALKARALGADFTLPGVSAAGAADAMTELAKAGFTVQQAMDAAKGTLQLARIAEISEGEASQVAAAAVNAFGIAAKDTTFVVDELASAANSSSVDIHDVDLAFRQASATFSGFQGPTVGAKEAITELNTAIAILGNNGIRGSDAGTSLKQMLLQLTGPTGRAKLVMQELAEFAAGATATLQQQTDVISSSTKVREKAFNAIEKANKGISDQGDIAFTADGKMRSLRETLDLVAKGTAGMTDELKAAYITQIFGADATRSIIALLKGGVPVFDKMRKAILQQGAAAEFAKAKNIGLKGSLDNVRSQVENIAIEIFNQVKGPLTRGFTRFAEVLAPLPKQINDLGQAIDRNKGTLIATAHALEVAAAAWFLYRSSIVAATVATRAWAAIQATIAFIQLAAGVRSFAAAWALLDTAMAANPIGIVVVAIAALAAGLVYAYKHSEKFRAIVDAVGRALRTAFTATINYITGTLVPNFVKAFDQVKAVTLSLYHNVILPVWGAIRTAITAVVSVVKAVVSGLAVAWNAVFGALRTAVSATVSFLTPAFRVMTKIFEIFRLIVLTVIYAVIKVIKFDLGVAINAFKFFWTLGFNFVKGTVIGWWNIVRAIFGQVKGYLIGPLSTSFNIFKAFATRAFQGVSFVISTIWNKVLKPVFTLFGNAISKGLVGAFHQGVEAIKTSWNLLKEAAKAPIKFVVNSVINPFIGGLNAAARIVGVPKKYQVSPIKLGYAAGGQIPGAPSFADNRIAMGPNGLLKVASGEFITNTKSTLANLGLVQAINAKRGKVTREDVDPYLDGYSRGGMIGDGFGIGGIWDKIVKGAKTLVNVVTNPGAALQKVANAALNAVPGDGMLKETVKGEASKVITGAIDWIKGKLDLFGGGALGSQNVFGGYKGMERLIAARFPGLHVISDFRPGARTLSGSRSYHGFGRAVDYPPVRALAAWIRATFGSKTKELISPWNDLNLLNGKPHRYTGAVWNQHNFAGGNAHVHWAARMGGLVGALSGMPVGLFDKGGMWPSGTLGVNMSGRTEYVDPNGRGGGDTITIVNHGVIASQDQADKWFEDAYKRAKKRRRIQ